MDIRDDLFSNEQMSDQIRNMLDSKNYSALSAYISESVNKALSLTRKGVKQGEYQIQKNIKAVKNLNSTSPSGKKKNALAPVAKVPAGTFSGPLLAVGSAGALIIAIISLFNLLFAGSSLLMIGILCVFLGCGIFLGLESKKIMDRVTRFKKYLKWIDLSSSSISIANLSSQSGRKEKFVLTDLNKMINLNMFPEGHISDDGKLLLLTDQAYHHYLTMEKEMSLRAADDQYRKKLEEEQPVFKEIHMILDEGDEILLRLQKTQSLVTNRNVKKDIAHLADILQRLLDDLRKNPAHYPEIRRFMNYYVPITWKIIDTYRELDTQPVCGTNMLQAKKEIESSLSSIISAYDNIFDELYQDKAFDVASDISTIKTMLSRDGLTKETKMN